MEKSNKKPQTNNKQKKQTKNQHQTKTTTNKPGKRHILRVMYNATFSEKLIDFLVCCCYFA